MIESKDNNNFTIKNESQEDSRTISAQDFAASFDDYVSGIAMEHVLIDITSLELDIILHLHHYFDACKRHQSLFVLYTAPNRYKGRDAKSSVMGMQLGNIAQPPGYISLRFEELQSCPHVIITGFDEDRAERFFDKYQWEDKDKYAIVGNASYATGLDVQKMAKQANAWINDINVKNVLDIDALNPESVSSELSKLFERHKMLDIIPLGPKLASLGATQFYFSRSEEERKNIRILFDFPRATPEATEGISKLLLYPLQQ